MFLLNYMHAIFNNAFRALRPGFRNETSERESTLLLERSDDTPSFSDRYEGFEQSFSAFQLCSFHVTCYYLAAVLFFSFLFEKWTVINSLYFATVLFTTVGFGDLSPSTFYGRLAVILLTVYGVVLLGIFLGIAGQNIMEYQTKLWDRQRNDVRRKMLRTVEKVSAERKEAGNTVYLETSPVGRAVEVSLIQEIKEVITLEGPILLVMLICGVVLGHLEGWTVFESIYFTVTTGTTIGFGDYHPGRPLVRLACCFFLPLLVAVFGQFLANVASVYMTRQRRRAEIEFLSRTMTVYDMQAMDENQDGEVQRTEFLAFMLVALNKVDKEDITEIMSLFDKLDVSKSGTIDIQDMVVSRSMMFRSVLDGSNNEP